MDKKDIYEHLAKIYLDASLKRKRKHKKHSRFKVPLLIGLSVCLTVVFLFVFLNRTRLPSPEIALVLQQDVTKINFNFNPAKKEILSIDLSKLNLSKFRAVGFSLRKTNFKDNISLRVEFNSRFNERSEIYIRDIARKWQGYRLNLSDFKGIASWRQMSSLMFIVEEWNTDKKDGVLYLDNVRLLR
jgi:hypothetical protein